MYKKFDKKFLFLIRQNSYLIVLFVIILLFLKFHDPLYIGGMLVAGAVAYRWGASLGFLVSLGFMIVVGMTSPLLFWNLSIQWVGYWLIIWLAYHHQERKQWLIQQVHADQVMSWSAVNDIRTSLAAVRYLLFPIHQTHPELKKATEELSNEISKIEKMFEVIEKKN